MGSVKANGNVGTSNSVDPSIYHDDGTKTHLALSHSGDQRNGEVVVFTHYDKSGNVVGGRTQPAGNVKGKKEREIAYKLRKQDANYGRGFIGAPHAYRTSVTKDFEVKR
jgi:hypothetical protein